AETPSDIIPEADQQVEDLLKKTEEPVAASETIPETIVIEQIGDLVTLPDTHEIEENIEPVTTKEEISVIETSETETELTIGPEEPAINIPALKIEPIDPAKAELIFEPFHTVDYFASQGIKFKEEEKPTDKFGLQLKSFTDWLKAMKKLPVTDIPKLAETNPGQSAIAERKVEQLAEHSISGKDVMTETMAEVWEKQGNHAKAIEVYEKLSLLDPSKRPYFAAKIADLKKIN
ncbi:MAG: hypothetical protein SGI83_07040, partial [Bacteroidota bacterium]|nr:hypothetical protein [Bacteroidota bacterium]